MERFLYRNILQKLCDSQIWIPNNQKYFPAPWHSNGNKGNNTALRLSANISSAKLNNIHRFVSQEDKRSFQFRSAVIHNIQSAFAAVAHKTNRDQHAEKQRDTMSPRAAFCPLLRRSLAFLPIVLPHTPSARTYVWPKGRRAKRPPRIAPIIKRIAWFGGEKK